MTPKIGVKLSSDFGEPDAYLEQARALEAAGVHSIWLSESLIRPAEGKRPYPPELEPWTLLAAVAAVTSRVHLGTSVSVIMMWPPVLFALKVSTLEHLSRGRCIVGAGAGWEPYQFSANGLSFEDRGARLDEYMVLLRHLWTGSNEPFDGDFYRVPGLRLIPSQRLGGPPLLLGAFSEPGYRRAARLADGFIHGGGRPDAVQRVFEHIRHLRRNQERGGPFEFWAQVPTPTDHEQWGHIVDSYGSAGADGLIVRATPRLLEILVQG